MPPLAIASLFQRTLPWLSSDGRAVLNTLISQNGRVESAQVLSERLGLRSRFQLGRLLRREGLPPYEELAGWVCVFYWMLRADAGEGRGALRALADHGAIELASSYRLVRRVTGHRWKELRREGTEVVTRWFLARVHPARANTRIDVRATRDAMMAYLPRVGHWSNGQPCRLPLPGKPYGIGVFDRDLAYVTRSDLAAVDRLDLHTGKLLGAIPVGCMPTCVAAAPAANRVYVSVQFCDEIAVIDTTRHCVVQSIRVEGDPFPLLLSPSGRTLFVTTNHDQLFAISLQTGRVMASLPLPATSHHLAVHPAGDRLYVATRAGGSVLEVDLHRFKVLRKFSVGGWPQGIVVSPDGATLFVANERQGLDVIRLGTGGRVATIMSEKGAVALALSPDRRFLYAGHARAGVVSMIEVSSLSRRGTLETGGRPAQIAFDGAGHVILVNEAGWLDILPVGVSSLRAMMY
jgi:DNA-binding beta-propeller fold protein YncE